MKKTLIKSHIIWLLVIGVCFSCKKTDQLTFESTTYTEGKCKDCPEINIRIPKALQDTKIDHTINASLEEELISLLTFDDEATPETLQEAIISFKKGYEEIQNLYPGEATNWEAKITGEIAFEDQNMLTIRLESYLFTGGAHGYTATRYLNFDKKKGEELENWELFDNKNDFEHFAEIKFRIQEHIPQNKPINSTGFMFEREEFYLPDNIGFTKKGIALCYNQYEVASYADGPIILTLPFNEVKKYLATRIK